MVLGLKHLERLPANQVLVQKWQAPLLRRRYYKLMDSSMALCMGQLGPEEADEQASIAVK